MRPVAMAVVLLVAVAFAYPTSAPCPYDRQEAPYTGHYKEVVHSDGKHILCEFAHPVNVRDASGGSHRFWQDCTSDF
jgi:hypothetical protein